MFSGFLYKEISIFCHTLAECVANNTSHFRNWSFRRCEQFLECPSRREGVRLDSKIFVTPLYKWTFSSRVLSDTLCPLEYLLQ